MNVSLSRHWTLLVLLLCVLAFAQEPSKIAGKVTDARGNPVPGATIRVTGEGSFRPVDTLSQVDGSFGFELPQGVYLVTAEMAGFMKTTKADVNTTAESSRSLVLQLGSLPRPPRPAISKAAPQQRNQGQDQADTTFQTAEVTDLPGFAQFQETGDLGAEAVSSRAESLLLINGNTASLDGISMGDPAFRQTMMAGARSMGFQVQEFANTGEGARGPGGEMGGDPGGGPGGGGFMGMGGRGGRGANFRQPKIQGAAAESFSNSALNARNYSLTGHPLPKPVLIQNNYSIIVGGVLPFIQTPANNQRRNAGQGQGGGRGGRGSGRPGWTFSYSGSRNRSAQDILTTVPTELERAGDFSQSLVQVPATDPATGQRVMTVKPVRLYRDPHDPSSTFTRINTIDPVAAGLLEFIPLANLPCTVGVPCVNNYAYQRSLPNHNDQIQGGATGLRLSSKDNLAVNYSARWGSSLNAGIFPDLDSTIQSFAQNIGISGTHSFRQRLNATWRVSLNRLRAEGTNSFAYTRNVLSELGMTGGSQEPINWGPPAINFTNYGDLSLSAPSVRRNQTFTVSGGTDWFGGRHSVRIGGDVVWAQRNSQADSNPRGAYSFTGFSTILQDSLGRQVSGTGNDFADFLMGLPYSTSRSFVDPAVNPYGNSNYLRNRTWSLFAMDNWRWRSNLTVNYGLRYEYTGPSYEKYNRLVSLDANQSFTVVARVFPNRTGPVSGNQFARSLINADRNNLAPRIGVAWKPSARSRFIIRSGYGIGYSPGGYSSIVNQLLNQAPFAVTQNLVTDRQDPLTLKVGFPVNPDVSILNTYAVDPYYRPSYAQQWNLDVQTQLSQLYVMNVSYNGARGTGLDVTRAPNRDSNASQFVFQTNGANSIYHALNAQLLRRFSHGFNVSNSYIFSKSIDDSQGSGGNSVAQNDSDLAAERALSSQDRRHNFAANFVYELPMGQNRRFFAGASNKILNFVAGWTFNGSFALTSGLPMTAVYASSNGTSGTALYNSLRPDATGAQVNIPWGERTQVKFFNTAAFAIPAGRFGTAGRNTITGPGSVLLNLALRKSFRLDENNRRVDFSCQVQNLLNHPNWGNVSTTINALNFGQVTSVRAMRAMTMNLRITF